MKRLNEIGPKAIYRPVVRQWGFRRSRLFMMPHSPSAQLGHGEWRTFCRCGGWTAGLPWTLDVERSQ